jgi:2'-5' RNA ligase
VRLFVAVNPPRQLCADLQTQLDAVRRQVRIAWTRPAAWHLTLAFLGEWPGERVAPLQDALQAAVAAHPPLTITPGGVGTFPDRGRPRVLFLHLDGGAPLQQLAATVRRTADAVWPDGPQDRKAFRPHLTLARIKRPLPARDRDRLARLAPGPWPPFPVTRVALMASELRPDGARHTEVAGLPLAG